MLQHPTPEAERLGTPMRCSTLAIVGGLMVLMSASVSRAQDPPFNGGGVVAFDPEISVVNSGALLDAQVVVSADRKYVTINARPSLSRLQALNVFPAVGVGLQPNGGVAVVVARAVPVAAARSWGSSAVRDISKTKRSAPRPARRSPRNPQPRPNAGCASRIRRPSLRRRRSLHRPKSSKSMRRPRIRFCARKGCTRSRRNSKRNNVKR